MAESPSTIFISYAPVGSAFVDRQALIDLGFLWAQRDYTQAGTYFQQALELAERMGDPRAGLTASTAWATGI